MISPKLAVLMAAFAMIGIGAAGALPMAAAQQESDVEVDRSNNQNQEIKQKQEACTNKADVNVSDDDYLLDIAGDNEAEVDQENNCLVTQTQGASNSAGLTDNSFNEIDLESILANVGLVL